MLSKHVLITSTCRVIDSYFSTKMRYLTMCMDTKVQVGNVSTTISEDQMEQIDEVHTYTEAFSLCLSVCLFLLQSVCRLLLSLSHSLMFALLSCPRPSPPRTPHFPTCMCLGVKLKDTSMRPTSSLGPRSGTSCRCSIQ